MRADLIVLTPTSGRVVRCREECIVDEGGVGMRKLTVGVLCFLVGVAVATAPTAGAERLRKGPYVIYPNEPSEMVVLVQAASDTSSPPTIRWGSTDEYGQGPVSMSAFGSSQQYRHEFAGLTHDTRYFYRVDLEGEQHAGSFRTAPAADASDVTFYAIGDTRSHPDQMNMILDTMLTDIDEDVASRETLWVHVGDWVREGRIESNWTDQFFDRSYPRSLEAMSRLALMGCRGNHETYPEGSTSRLFRKYFPYRELVGWPVSPDPRNDDHYFSFDYGPVHFAVVDDESSVEQGDPQYNWLGGDLRATCKKWIVVVFHKPAYSAGGGHGNNGANMRLIDDMKCRFGVDVDMVLAGHNHYYARCEADDVVHLTVGGGGAPLGSPDPNFTQEVVKAVRALSFARFDVADTILTCTVLDDEGATIDSFTIDDGPDTTPPSVSKASGLAETRTITVTFDEAVQDGVEAGGAENADNYRIPGLTITGAKLCPKCSMVDLTVSTALVPEQDYKLSVSGIRDRASPPNTMSPSTIALEFTEVKIALGDEWKYFEGRKWPGDDWNEPDFNDSLWDIGPTGIGYADNDDATVVDMENEFTTVFMRREFTVADPGKVTKVLLNIDYDDGFVAYINGTRVTSRNAPNTIAHNETAPNKREAGRVVEIDITDLARGVLQEDNVLAIILFNECIDSSDASLIPELLITTGGR